VQASLAISDALEPFAGALTFWESTMRLQFQTVDVFTSDRFAGNPLAVVLNAEGLSAPQMQTIAAEFNLAETTFIRPPKDAAHTAEVRIFTPRSEMPFAGHPNVGTAFVLARAGISYGRPVNGDSVIFEEKAGLVPVEILRDGATAVGARLASPQPLSVGAEIQSNSWHRLAGFRATISSLPIIDRASPPAAPRSFWPN
jgi:trans-2,3-dihydro-3-hydroxyanthranilate isomerase